MLRVSLKSLWSRKGRFFSTFLAVLLGVAFLVGVLVFSNTATQAFDELFDDVNRGTDAFVRSSEVIDGGGFSDDQRSLVPASVAEEILAVDGVADAAPAIQAYAQLVDKDGDLIGDPNNGPPTFGMAWIENDELNPFRVVDGTEPLAPDDVVVDKRSADDADLAVGDQLTIIVATGEALPFRLSGIAKFGDADSPLGASTALFTLATAEAVLAEPGKANGIAVVAEGGVGQGELSSRLNDALGDQYEAITGEQLAEENKNDVEDFLVPLQIAMTVFAVIAVLVGGFVIFNSFRIITAQRTRELALLRAVGASRRQALGSVVLEALIVGLLASLAGVAFGLLLAYGIRGVFAGFGLDFPGTGLVVEPAALVTGVVVGVFVTLASSLWPALEASRVPPIAALRDVAVEQTSVSRARIIAGTTMAAFGVIVVAGAVIGSMPIGLVGLAVVATLVGTVTLGPVLAGPVSRFLGAPLARYRGVTGTIARENAMRNPRRTAVTAAALLIGVGVVSLITVLAGSIKESIGEQIDRSFVGDVSIDSGSFGFGGFSPQLAQDVKALPEVAASAGFRFVRGEIDDGGADVLVVDADTTPAVIDLGVVDGAVQALDGDGLGVYVDRFRDEGWTIGSQVPMRFVEGGERLMTVEMVFDRKDFAFGDFVVGRQAHDELVPNPVDQMVLVEFGEGVSFEQGRAAVEAAVAGYPNAEVKDSQELMDTYTEQIDQMLALVYVMLALAVIIALVGIANTLRLSILERTHELGLLRAVGMTKRQIRASVRYESAIIAVFGTVGGLVLGVFFGWALVDGIAEASEQYFVFRPPIGMLVTIMVLGAVAGVVAAIRPAAKAAKLDILAAIATE